MRAVPVLILCFGVLWATQTPASPPKPFELAPVKVWADPALFVSERVTANVGFLNRQDFHEFPARDAGEALRFLPGLFMQFSGGLGALSIPSIHGSEARQVKVYMDGVCLNQLGNPTADLSPVLLNQVETIQVIKGAATSRWNSASGGVLNISTRRPDTAHGPVIEARMSAGRNDTLLGEFSAFGAPPMGSYLVTAAHRETGGFLEHGASRHDNVMVRLGKTFQDRFQVSLVANYMEGWFENPLPTVAAFWERSRSRRFYQVVEMEGVPSERLLVSLSLRNHRFTSLSDRHHDADVGTVRAFDYLETTRGGSAELNYAWREDHLLTVGASGDWGTYDFSPAQGDVDTRTTAWSGGYALKAGEGLLNAGVRYDEDLDFGSRWSPSAGWAYPLPWWESVFRVQLAWGFDAPPATWAKDPDFGNPSLGPERSMDVEVGWRARPKDRLRLGINGFWAVVDGFIVFDFSTRRYRNLDEAWRRGIEAWGGWDIGAGLGIEAAFTWVDAVDRETGRVIRDVPRQYWNFGCVHRGEHLFQSLRGRWVHFNSSLPETRDRRFLLDYHVRYTFPQYPWGTLEPFGSILNLLNTSHYHNPAFPEPDRTFQVGLAWKW